MLIIDTLYKSVLYVMLLSAKVEILRINQMHKLNTAKLIKGCSKSSMLLRLIHTMCSSI